MAVNPAPTRVYFGQITSASTDQDCDPDTVLYSAAGTASYNGVDPFFVENKKADNHLSYDVQTHPAKAGDPCEIWAMPDGRVFLILKTSHIPHDDCDNAGGGSGGGPEGGAGGGLGGTGGNSGPGDGHGSPGTGDGVAEQ